MGDYFRFGLVFTLKNNQTGFKKNWNRTETESNWPISVWSGSVRFLISKNQENL